MHDHDGGPSSSFIRRTLFQFGVAAFLFVCWQLADVILLAFGAVIVAVLLRSVADPLRDRTPLPDPAALAVALLLIAALLAGAAWLFGSTVEAQITGLTDRLPHSAQEVRDLVSRLPFGESLAGQAGDVGDWAARLQAPAGRLGGYAIGLVGAVTHVILVVFAGVYLAMNPAQARDGLASLFPDPASGRVRDALNATGRALHLWLLGTLADMTVVGVLTAAGTGLIGLPSPVALGLFAAIVSFVPIVGPIVSVAPAILLALYDGPEKILWTVLVYIGVQQIESNLFYPFIQRRAVNLPPVLTLFGVAAFGVLLGPMGAIFATPLLLVLMVLIKMLYLRGSLGRDVTIPGEQGKAK